MEGEDTVTVTSRFPPPPVYFKYYGEETEECHETAVSKEPPKPPEDHYQVANLSIVRVCSRRNMIFLGLSLSVFRV